MFVQNAAYEVLTPLPEPLGTLRNGFIIGITIISQKIKAHFFLLTQFQGYSHRSLPLLFKQEVGAI